MYSRRNEKRKENHREWGMWKGSQENKIQTNIYDMTVDMPTIQPKVKLYNIKRDRIIYSKPSQVLQMPEIWDIKINAMDEV